jgi:hypothetical protein
VKTIKFILPLLFSLLFAKARAQSVARPEINLDEFILKLSATQQEDSNYEDLYEALLQFYLNPLDINRATADELRSFFVLSEIQIQELIRHRSVFGDLISLYELQAMDTFNPEAIQKLLPFIKIGSRIKLSDITGLNRRNTDHFLVIRAEQTLQKSKGYLEDKFLGSPQKFYARYRLQHPKDFSLGLIVEKDQGEPHLADYFTAHFQLQNKGRLKNMIIGDYQLQFGQGLVVSGGYAAGKGGETIYTVRRSDLGIRPHNSVLESGFFRGAAITYALRNTEISAFGSVTKRDASRNTDAGPDENLFSSLLVSGLHRTETELEKKRVLGETSAGMNAKWLYKGGYWGLTVLHTSFTDNIERNQVPYAHFEFKGRQNTVVGSNFSYSWQNFNFFGEAARSSSGGIGAVGGFVASLSPKFEWALHLRNYDKDFHSFYANAFGEGSSTINEKGIYTGIKYMPAKGVTLAAFYDRFSFPWLRYLVDAPSSGDDYLFRLTLKPTRIWTFYLQHHREQKQRNMPSNKTVSDYLVGTYRQNLLANFDYTPSRVIKLQTRLQYNSFRYEGLSRSNGIALIQDIEGLVKERLQLKGRIAFFKTDDYNSRIYAYENDVLYSVSFPAYFGKGMRYYLVSRYTINRDIDVWFRIAHSEFVDAESVGSGLNEIPGSRKTDVKFQIRYKF